MEVVEKDMRTEAYNNNCQRKGNSESAAAKNS